MVNKVLPSECMHDPNASMCEYYMILKLSCINMGSQDDTYIAKK